jgi:hypothetical protein
MSKGLSCQDLLKPQPGLDENLINRQIADRTMVFVLCAIYTGQLELLPPELREFVLRYFAATN